VRKLTLRISRRDFVKIAGTTLVLSSIPISLGVVSGIRQPSVSRLEAIGSREVVRTFCGMCGALCGIQVVNVDGRIAYVEPLDGHPQRGLCGRSASTVWLWDSPLRLRKPLKRVGERGEASFQEVDWDTALNEIAAKLREVVAKYGYKSIAITHHDVWSYYMPLLSYLFGTPNIISHVGMCHASGTVARGHVLGAGGPPSVDPDYENASYILFVSRTPGTASMGVLNRLRGNRKVRIVVVDPRMPEIGLGDAEWIPIIPGADTAFLLSLAHVIIEERLYDETFLKYYSNAPFLIKPDGKPLTEADLVEKGDAKKYMVWDAKTGKPVDHKTPGIDPDLLYEGDVTLKDGTVVRVRTAFQLFRERCSKYKPEEASRITGVPAETIRRIARELALYKGVVDDTWYISRNGNDYDDVRAALILNVLLGNIDKPGGLCFQESARFPSAITVVTRDGKRYARTFYDAEMPEELFGDVGAPRVDRAKYRVTPATFDAVLDAILTGDPYPIRALFVIGTTPIHRDMDVDKIKEALGKLDLLVVIDILPQDIVDYADYVLPDTTYLERDEFTTVKWTLHAAVHLQRKITEPPEGCDARSALWIMFEIARRAFPERARALSWRDEYADYHKFEELEESLGEILIRKVADTWKTSLETLRKELEDKGHYTLKKKEYMVSPYKKALGTPSGKCEIYSLTALGLGLDPLPDYRPPPAYPLPKADDEFYLVNGKGPLISAHALLMEPMRFFKHLWSVWMNPRDAERLGIKDGDLVELESLAKPGKRVKARVWVTEMVREKVLFTYSFVGRRSKLLLEHHFAREGVNINELNKAYVIPIVGGGASNTSVRVRRVT
jgi:thiosulfate reductase/polysulfide reductase chain A